MNKLNYTLGETRAETVGLFHLPTPTSMAT